MTRIMDFSGMTFGRVTVIEPVEGRGKRRYRCACACGSEFVCIGSNLRSGCTKSCGCHNRAVAAEKARQRSTIHGANTRAHKTSEYNSWWAMHGRCRYPTTNSYERYGGRGITVCDRWQDFTAFLEDMGPKPSPKHSIERINSDGNYEPDNCRWATGVEQAANRRAPNKLSS